MTERTQAAREAAGQPLPATGGLFRLARLGWYLAAALALAVLLASIPGYLSMPPLIDLQDILVYEPTPTNQFLAGLNAVAAVFAAALSLGLATLLFIRKSKERMGLFLAYYLLGHGVIFAGPLDMLPFFWPAASWVTSFAIAPIFHGPVTIALLGAFPDGRFVPRWSRWLVLVSAVLFPIAAGSQFYLALLGSDAPETATLAVGLGIVAITVGVAVYAQAYRYRRVSTRAQRQQTKWVLYSLALYFPLILAVSPALLVASDLPPGSAAPWWLIATAPAFSVAASSLPISLTIAVMRYRLFDIDLLIHRTLVYGALTAALAAAYFGGVALVQALFRILTGQETQFAIVVSTLIIAALFQPLRRRIQDGIDRRFYRRKYDAQQALAAFSATARNEVDLEELSAAMLALVRDTLQPRGVSLWLRPPDLHNQDSGLNRVRRRRNRQGPSPARARP